MAADQRPHRGRQTFRVRDEARTTMCGSAQCDRRPVGIVVGGEGRRDRPHHPGEAVHRTERGPYGVPGARKERSMRTIVLAAAMSVFLVSLAQSASADTL